MAGHQRVAHSRRLAVDRGRSQARFVTRTGPAWDDLWAAGPRVLARRNSYSDVVVQDRDSTENITTARKMRRTTAGCLKTIEKRLSMSKD